MFFSAHQTFLLKTQLLSHELFQRISQDYFLNDYQFLIVQLLILLNFRAILFNVNIIKPLHKELLQAMGETKHMLYYSPIQDTYEYNSLNHLLSYSCTLLCGNLIISLNRKTHLTHHLKYEHLLSVFSLQ